MLKAIKSIIHAIREEAKRRGWFTIMKALIILAGYIGLSILALNPLLKWLFPLSVVVAWVVIFSLAVIIILLVIVNFMRTYHERKIKEALDEWAKRIDLLEKLYGLLERGKHLAEKCTTDGPLPIDETKRWSGNAAFHLEKIGIEYRRRFFEHSETGEGVPESFPDCRSWIETRMAKIQEVIAELKQPPPQLIPPSAMNQIESSSMMYFGTGKNY